MASSDQVAREGLSEQVTLWSNLNDQMMNGENTCGRGNN